MGSSLRFKSRIFRICLYLERTPAGGIRASQGTFSSLTFSRQSFHHYIILLRSVPLILVTHTGNDKQRNKKKFTLKSNLQKLIGFCIMTLFSNLR